MLTDMEMKFFRSLQGVAESVKIIYLRKVSADIKSVLHVTTEIEKLKQKRKLEEVFRKLTNCTSWEEAKMLYPEHAEKLDDLLDSNISRKNIPQGLVDFCKEGPLVDSMPGVTVDIRIKKIGVIVENNNLIQLIKRKVEKELKGSKRLHCLLGDEARELESQPHEE